MVPVLGRPAESFRKRKRPARLGAPSLSRLSAMVRHFRLLCFALFIVLILAVHTVQGQVAVPAFAPASPKLLVPGLTVPDATLAPENPAANHWGAPARFGLGQIAAELKQEVTLGTDVERDFDGIYAGFRWVTDAFSLSVEAIDVDSSDGAYDARVTNAALSLLAADFLAVGLGLWLGLLD